MSTCLWLLIGLLAAPQAALAGGWEKAMTDFNLYQQVMTADERDMQEQQYDAPLEDSGDLFPATDEEQSSQSSGEASLSDTHVTIKVDGVPVELTDVPLNQWFAKFVKDAAEQGLVSGYRNEQGRPNGLYGPSDAVTLEQIAKMAVIAGGIDTYGCGDTLLNASAKGRWSESFVRCAEHEHWAVFSDGSADVSHPATRSEVVVTVLQAFKARIAPVSGTVFRDVDRATVFGNAIETAANAGIVSGFSDANGNPTGFFGPNDAVTRAEVAKIFSLAIKLYGKR